MSMSDLHKWKQDNRARQIICNECGGRVKAFHIHGNNGHKDTCYKFEHIPDDHYDSACMNGRCKYCNPDYKPTRQIKMSDEEYEAVMDFLNDLRSQE